MLGVLIVELFKNGALADIDIIIPQGFNDTAHFAGRDESRLQIRGIRVMPVQVIDSSLMPERLASLLPKNSYGIGGAGHFEAYSGRKAFPQTAQRARM